MTSYRRHRNLVRRELDGRLVNVARARGHIFVCANACCCGRTDLTNAPVPTERYHDEWTRRRLRNFVHLTIGGCLGPCALANVALLLFDGRSTWFHSMNDEAAVVALFDHVQALLETDGEAELPAALAGRAFTAYQWEPRPDGQPLDDHRRWRGIASRPEATPACELTEADLQVAAATPAESDFALSVGPAALPRANGEPVFAAPWESRAFGMAVATAEGPAWEAFRQRLIDEIAASERGNQAFDYYAAWLRAFEATLLDEGLLTPEEIEERTAEFEFGERQEVF